MNARVLVMARRNGKFAKTNKTDFEKFRHNFLIVVDFTKKVFRFNKLLENQINECEGTCLGVCVSWQVSFPKISMASYFHVI